tara:strand:- start:380 stop:1579 length:1200 start_codon:yes stop_codon:yes gene_type:complete
LYSEKENHFTVSELNDSISSSIRSSYSNFWIIGEISDFHHHNSSGHIYFSLKDEYSEIRSVMFRTSNQFLKFKPENGSMVKIFGSVSVFEKRGQIQLICNLMEELGLGLLFQKFDLLKKKLDKEGLFSIENKNKLPKYPESIGVLTSGSGAAFQDILKVLRTRSPHIKIYLRSTAVQGSNAGKDIVQGINDFMKFGNVELIILGRGGGSMEDLWAFNEEIVARSIARCSIPIVTGIGHETDFTIADLVADVRAPTPSAAAEIISDRSSTMIRDYKTIFENLNKNFFIKSHSIGQKLDYLYNLLIAQKPQAKVELQNKTIQDFRKRLYHSSAFFLKDLSNILESFNKRLNGLNPEHVLKRGYSIATNDQGQIIYTKNQLELGEKFDLKTSDGIIGAKKIS